MSTFERLYQLQLIDKKLKENELAQQDQTDLRHLITLKKREQSLVQELQRSEKCLKDLQSKTKQSEAIIQEITVKIKDLEKRLYSGTGQNMRELEHMEVQVAHQKESKNDLENDLIQALEVIESLEKDFAALVEEQRKLSEDSRSLETTVRANRHNLKFEARRLTNKRNMVLESIPPELYKHYEQVSANHDGVAVAKIKKGLCLGCQMKLSPVLQEKAKNSTEVVHCEFCGRILYYPQPDESEKNRP